jgi:hypothetical protein
MPQSDRTPREGRPLNRSVFVIAILLTLAVMLGVGYLLGSLTLP